MNYRRWAVVGFVAALAIFSFWHLSTAGSDYEILTTSDSGFFYGIAREVNEGNGLIETYELSHAPQGKSVSQKNMFQPLMLVTMYRGIHAVDPGLTLMEVSKYFSPFMFAIAMIGAFLAARELGGDLAGGASALFFSTMVGSIYWTKLGAFDREITLIFFGTWLFYILTKIFQTQGREMLMYSAFGGLLYGMFLITWPGAPFLGAIIGIVLGLIVLERAVSGLGFVLAGIGLFVAGQGFGPIDVAEILGLVLFLGGLVRVARDWEALEKIESEIGSSIRSHSTLIGGVFGLFGIATIVAVVFGEYSPGFWLWLITERIPGFIGLGGGAGVSFPRVAQEMAPAPADLGGYLNAMSSQLYVNSKLTWVTILLVGLGLLKSLWKKTSKGSLLVVSWLIIIAPMPIAQSRFFRLFWPVWPILAGFGFSSLVWMLKKLTFSPSFSISDWWEKVRHPVVLAIVFVFLVTPFIHNARANATDTQPSPHGSTLPSVYFSLMDSYDWIKENTAENEPPENVTVAVEWSHGHLLTGYTGRGSVADGTQSYGWRGEWRNSSGFKPPDYIKYKQGGKGYIIGKNTFSRSYKIDGRRIDIEEPLGTHSLYRTTEENELEWLLRTYRDNFGVKIDYIVYNEGINRIQGAMKSFLWSFLRSSGEGIKASSASIGSQTRTMTTMNFTFENENIIYTYSRQFSSVTTQDGERLGGVMLARQSQSGYLPRLVNYKFFKNPDRENLLIVLMDSQGRITNGYLFEFEGAGKDTPMIYRARMDYDMPDFMKEMYSTTHELLNYEKYKSKAEVYKVIHENISS